jgi:hypothetical protein
MVSRQFAPSPGIAGEDRAALDGLALQATSEGQSRVHALVQLEYIPSQAERDALARQGLILLQYIPNYAWIAAVPADNPAAVAGVPGVRWVGSLAASDKVDASLAIESSPWAYDAATNRAALYVTMHQDVRPEVSEPLLSRYGQVVSYASSANLYVLWVDRAQVDALLNEDLVSWVQPAEPKWEPDNNVTRARIDSDDLDSATYNYADGTNVDILIYDGGWVRSTHQELTGRVTQRDANCSVADHATHVACTTSASGFDAAATGMANNMHAILSDCMSTITGAYYYTDPGELQSDLVYAKDTWNATGGDADGAELLSASVDTNPANKPSWPCVWEGNYGPTDVILDNMVRGDTASSGKFIAAWANGNERGYTRCGTTYGTTTPPACGKNVISVGATNKDADTMTSFSSWGPCDDGRIKPVISAPGCATDGSGGIYSCYATADNAYGTMCGTSMATPAVAGVVAQLIEYCRAQGLSYCSASGEFWPSSARALLMQTAVDLGNAGPDYQYGYGRIDADAAADLITNNPPGNSPDFRQDLITNQGEIDSYQITVSGSPAQLKVSLAWDDEAATMQALKKLVNDLDLEVVSPNATVYRPYILDPNNPGNAATTGVDSVNNQEQVVVTSPANGVWTIRVIGRTVPAAPQDYTVVFPNAYTTAPTETPGATPTATPTTNPAYCGESITNGSIESGTTGWTTSGSAVQSSAYAHAGTKSMVAGGTADGTFYQDIAVPADMYFGTISFWYRMQTSEVPPHPYDFFDVEVRTTANQALTTLLSTDDSKGNGVWTQASFTIGPEYAGRNIRLYFSADVDTAVNTYWYVDEVSVNLCGTGATPTPSPTPTPGATFVYDQTDNSSGVAVISQNFEALYDAYDDQAADDFLVPASDGSWTIQNIQIPGQYWAGTGPLASVNVWFYQDSGSLPGSQVFGQLGLVPTSDASGSLVLDLPSPPTLPPGTYWLSVQANMDFDTGGEWGPTTRLVQSYSPWAWRNPGNGLSTGCTAWTTNGSCGFTSGPDLLFRLSGTKGGGDSDGDTVPDSTDNCPFVYNPGQENADAAIDNGPGIPGHDTTIPNAVADSQGDACETDGDADNDGLPDAQDTNPLGATGICALFNGSNDGHPHPAGGDVTNDDNHNGDPAFAMGTDASDNGPSWDTDNDGALDGAECTLGHNPRDRTDRPSTADCGGTGDTDGDGLLDAWEKCGWGTNPNVVDSDGDTRGDCTEAVDTNGNGIILGDFAADALNSARATLLPAGVGAGKFGKTMDFDLNGNGIVAGDFGADTLTTAKMTLGLLTCK